MKKWIMIGILLNTVVLSAYAQTLSKPASKEYVDQVFCAIELQIKALNNQPLVCTA